MAYIDTEILKRNIRKNLMPNVDVDGTVTVECAERYFLKLIDITATVDIVKVKHGEWIKTDRGVRIKANTGQPMRVYYCDCSCCGWHTGHQGIDFKYCPECGAEMDGRRDA